MATRKVIVNGVEVDLFDDESPSRTAPMRASLRFIAESPHTDTPPEAIAALRAAGVKSLPLYQSEARAAGIEWEEVGT